MSIIASIDIGSNSVLLLVAKSKSGQITELYKDSWVTGLGRDLDKNKFFLKDAMDETYECLKSYKNKCVELKVSSENILVTATEASRVASNSLDFFKKIEKNLGLKVIILTTEGEAYFSTKGILYNTDFVDSAITVMDIGGASTELIKLSNDNKNIQASISMPIGSVRCSNWLAEETLIGNLQSIYQTFDKSLETFICDHLYCVAGTMTSLANIHMGHKEFQENEVHGYVLSREDITSLFQKYGDSSEEFFLEKFPFLGKRARSIRGGLHLIYHLSSMLRVQKMTISTYGLRYGTLLEGEIPEKYIFNKAR